MARLASGAKMGFYPTPVEVCEIIKGMIKINEGVLALDPCCGEGEALDIIAPRESGAIRYGIELDRTRYVESVRRLDHVVLGDALRDVEIQGRFDLLFLNPPYDYDSLSSERLETLFLNRYMFHVANGGLIIHVVPLEIVSGFYSKAYPVVLEKFSKEIKIYRFPDDLFPRFRQVVVFQRFGRATEKEREGNQELLDWLRTRALPQDIETIDAATLEEPFEVKSRNTRIRKFISYHITDDQYESAFQKSDVSSYLSIFDVPEVIDVVPLAQLRVGHLAMLVASGMTNGVKIPVEDGFMVIKGMVERKTSTFSHEGEDGKTETIITEKPSITVKVLFVRSDGYAVETIS